jgi:MarR family transcriptional regulator for hemolysin
MPKLDPYESLGFLCALTLRSFTAALEKRLSGSNVSSAQFVALAHLTALGPLAQRDLAERLAITPATAVRLVNRLERDGWVTRQDDPEDKRVNLVAATDKAEEIWQSISESGRSLLEQAYRGVHPAELETTKGVLAQVRRNLTR